MSKILHMIFLLSLIFQKAGKSVIWYSLGWIGVATEFILDASEEHDSR